MLKATTFFRPLLLRPTCLTTSSFSLHRVPTGSLRTQPDVSLWKPRASLRCYNTEEGFREVSPTVESNLRFQDQIPDGFKLIYRVQHEFYIKFTYTTAVLVLMAAPAIFLGAYFTTGYNSYPIEMAGIPLFNSENDVYLLSLMLVLTTVNLALTVSKYPFRIYRNPVENKYIAVFQHPIPGMRKRLEYNAGEAKPAKSWLWKDLIYSIKNKKVFILPEQFVTPIELVHMTTDPKENDPVEIHKRRSRRL